MYDMWRQTKLMGYDRLMACILISNTLKTLCRIKKSSDLGFYRLCLELCDFSVEIYLAAVENYHFVKIYLFFVETCDFSAQISVFSAKICDFFRISTSLFRQNMRFLGRNIPFIGGSMQLLRTNNLFPEETCHFSL